MRSGRRAVQRCLWPAPPLRFVPFCSA